MVPKHRSLRTLSFLASILISSFLIAYILYAQGEFLSVGFAVGALMPYVIASLTGAAQTTTV